MPLLFSVPMLALCKILWTGSLLRQTSGCRKLLDKPVLAQHAGSCEPFQLLATPCTQAAALSQSMSYQEALASVMSGNGMLEQEQAARARREYGAPGNVARSCAGGGGRNAHGRHTSCLPSSRHAEQGWRRRQEAGWQGQGLTARWGVYLRHQNEHSFMGTSPDVPIIPSQYLLVYRNLKHGGRWFRQIEGAAAAVEESLITICSVQGTMISHIIHRPSAAMAFN